MPKLLLELSRRIFFLFDLLILGLLRECLYRQPFNVTNLFLHEFLGDYIIHGFKHEVFEVDFLEFFDRGQKNL